MSYYAAGDYYSAGGFSFKKLARFVKKVAAPIVKSPLLSVATSFLPGGGLIGAIGGIVSSPFGSALGAAAHELGAGGGRHAMRTERGTPVTRHATRRMRRRATRRRY